MRGPFPALAGIAIAALGALTAYADELDGPLKAAKLWGGPFAANCTMPASIYNWYATITDLEGAPTITWFPGPEHPNNVYVVKAVKVLDDGSLQVTQELQRDHAISETVYAFRPDHSAFRPMSIHVKHGSIEDTVADKGVFVKSRQPTPWYVGCKS